MASQSSHYMHYIFAHIHYFYHHFPALIPIGGNQAAEIARIFCAGISPQTMDDQAVKQSL